MANRDFKCIFKDGCEYEVRLYHLGGIKIRSETGTVLFDNGLYLSQDVIEILDRFKDELKAVDKRYDNPMDRIEEVERMFQLEERELMKVFRDCVDTFIEKYIPNMPPEDEKTMVKLLDLFSNYAYSRIIEADIEKLDKMAEGEA